MVPRIFLEPPNGEAERTFTVCLPGGEKRQFAIKVSQPRSLEKLAGEIATEFHLADPFDVEQLLQDRLDSEAADAADLLPTVNGKLPERVDPDLVGAMAWRPFPVDQLPVEVKTFVCYMSHAIGVDESAAALLSLVVCAGAIGASRKLELDPEWTVPSLLWGAVVGRQSSKKSPILQKCLEPLEAIEGELPDDKRLIVDDITIQELAPKLDENPSGILAYKDELLNWFVSLDAYNHRSDGYWNQIYNALTLRYNRRGGPPESRSIRVPNACVSIAGGIQPSTLAEVMEPKYQHSGLASRWLFVMPPKRWRKYSRSGKSASGTAGFKRVIRDLCNLRPDFETEAAEWSPDGDDLDQAEDTPSRVQLPPPTLLYLTDEAGQLWEDHVNKVERELYESDGDDDLLEGIRGKLIGTAGRLALVLQLADEPTANEVSARWLQVGIDLAEWFYQEARRVWALVRSEPQARYGTLLNWLSVKGAVTARDVSRGLRMYRGPGGSERAEVDLRELVRAGLATSERRSTGGMPAEAFKPIAATKV
ncbi:MAG: DUF3987 domain-containing protein [Pirellulaceae bacterium]|nr:DUF3987 domain-containing protein [Pirellulaceae bacterium]